MEENISFRPNFRTSRMKVENVLKDPKKPVIKNTSKSAGRLKIVESKPNKKQARMLTTKVPTGKEDF